MRCGSGAFSKKQYTAISLILSLVTTITLLASTIPNLWDTTEYDLDVLGEKLSLVNDTNSSSAKYFKIERISQEGKYSVAILWDDTGGPDCKKRQRNGTILMQEHSGIWQLCRSPRGKITCSL